MSPSKVVFTRLSRGIYITYDKYKDPYLIGHVQSSLRKTSASPAMQTIIRRIGAASPSQRMAPNTASSKSTSNKINVLIQAPIEKRFSERANGQGRTLSMASKTSASELSGTKATNGAGSACWLYFSSLEFSSSPLHITFAHELIHCLHALEGTMKADHKQEEYYTVGIHGHEAELLTENRVRNDLGMELRDTYFKTDPDDYVATLQ